MSMGEVVVAIVLGAVGSVIAAEFMNCLPKLTQWLLRRAVARLPEDQRERFREEWAADLEERASVLMRLCAVFGMFFCAKSIPDLSKNTESNENVFIQKTDWN